MKPLDERHADRAQRKANNMAESTLVAVGGKADLGRVANMMTEAMDAFRALSEDERAELKGMLGEDFGADGGANTRSLAEGEDGGLSLAGIGTINHEVVPLETALKASGSEALTGKLPDASFDPANGNINGQAVEAAGATAATMQGWGNQAGNGGGGGDDGYRALSVAELKANLDGRETPVTYAASSNKDALIDLARAADIGGNKAKAAS